MKDFLLKPIGERIIAIARDQIVEISILGAVKEGGELIPTIDEEGNDGWEVILVSPPAEPTVLDMLERQMEKTNGPEATAAAAVFMSALEHEREITPELERMETFLTETRDERARWWS